MQATTLAALISKHTVSVMDYALGMDKPRTKGYISLEIVEELGVVLEAESGYCVHCGSGSQVMKGPLPYCSYCDRQKFPVKATEFIKRSKEV